MGVVIGGQPAPLPPGGRVPSSYPADRLSSVVLRTPLDFAVSRLRALVLGPSGFEIASCLLPQHEGHTRAITLEAEAQAGRPVPLVVSGQIIDLLHDYPLGPVYLGPAGELVSTPPQTGFHQQLAVALEPNRLLLTLDAASESGGGGGGGYLFEQSVPDTTWTINHGLNRYPTVVLLDSAGDLFDADCTFVNLNTLRVTLIAPTAGKAYLS